MATPLPLLGGHSSSSSFGKESLFCSGKGEVVIVALGKALDKQEKLILTFTEADKKVGKCFGLFIDLLRPRRGRRGMAMASSLFFWTKGVMR